MALSSLRLYRAVIATVLVTGSAGLLLNAILTFEEPSNGLLITSAVLLLAPVAGVFLHLAFTRRLTAEQRRTWFEHLASGRCVWAVAEYFSCDDLVTGAATLSRTRERNTGGDAAQ